MRMLMIALVLVLALGASLARGEVAAGEISGVVTDEAGMPLEGVLVDVWTWHPGNETKTDKDGRYTLSKLNPRGTVEIRFSKEGFGPFYNHLQATGVELNVKLSNRTLFAGRVVGPDGKAVPNALIRANSGPKRAEGVVITDVWTETTSNGQGEYFLYVQPDRYDIQVRAPGVGVYRNQGVTIGEGQSMSLELSLERGITFKAKLVDADTQEPVAKVRLWHWQHKGVEGTSDAQGMLTVEDMRPGNFDFEVEVTGYTKWWSADAVQEWQRSVQPRGNWDSLTFNIRNDMEPVTILMQKGVTITGHVIDPLGNPVSGATVGPARTGTGNSITGDTRFSVVTKEDGSFVMTIPASNGVQHNLIAHDGKYGETRRWANGAGEPMQTTPGQQIKNVDLKLTRGATVRGRAVDPQGQPAADKEVRAIALDGLDNRYYVPTTRTDKDGKFELKLIRPTEQAIQVEPFFLDPKEAPQGTTQTLKLEDGQSVEGIEVTTRSIERIQFRGGL